MYRLPTSSLALCVLVLSCGAPAELDRDAFPAPEQTGYDNPSPIGGAGMGGSTVTGNGGTASSGQGGTVAGTGGTVSTGGTNTGGTTGGTGTTGNGAGGTGTPAQGGTGNAQGGTGNAQGGTASAGGCPTDITELFNRPGNQGGCADPGCHVPGGTPPDLVSPGVVDRLLNVSSMCNSRPFVGAGDSFLAEKVTTRDPECGSEMPLFQGQALSAQDEQCIVDWIDQVGGG